MQKKDEILWTKTLLSVYRYLERICGAIDKIILQRALNCSNVTGQNYFYNNVFSITQRLIDLSQRKVTLINLKILIEGTLSKIDEQNAKILIEKYFDGRKYKEIATNHNFSMRTVFRKIENAEKCFCCALKMKGYGAFKLQNMLKNENWINNVYARFAEKENDDLELSNSFLERAVSM